MVAGFAAFGERAGLSLLCLANPEPATFTGVVMGRAVTAVLPLLDPVATPLDTLAVAAVVLVLGCAEPLESCEAVEAVRAAVAAAFSLGNPLLGEDATRFRCLRTSAFDLHSSVRI